MTNKLAPELTALGESDIDLAADFALVHDTSAALLKRMLPADLAGASFAGGASPGLYPLTAVAGDVTAAPTLTSDDYVDVIARWDGQFTSGQTKKGVTVTKQALTGTTNDGNTIYAYKFEPQRATHSLIIVGALHGNEKDGAAALLDVAKLFYNNTLYGFNQIRGDTTLYFIPVGNPDGYDINSRTNTSGTAVDLNRNWGSDGFWSDAFTEYSSADADKYQGASEYSEIETIAIKGLIDTAEGLTGVIDVHTYGVSIDVHAGIIPPACNETVEIGQFMWAAKEAFGAGAKIDPESRTTRPPPWMVNYVSGLDKWGVILELGKANVDVTNTTDMAKAVNWLGNSIIAMASLPSRKHREATGPQFRQFHEGQFLNLETDNQADGDGPEGDGWIDTVRYTVTNGTYTTDFATDNKLRDVGHLLVNGDTIQLSSDGALPPGSSEHGHKVRTTYWVINKTDDDFEISVTGPNGVAVTITGDGSGTHTWTKVVDYGMYVPVDFQGVAIALWKMNVYPGGDTGDQLYFRPHFGQNVGVFSREDSIARLAEEGYASGDTSKRSNIVISAMRFVMPSAQNTTDISVTDLAFRCQYKNVNAPSGTPVLFRLNSWLVLIPSNGGPSFESWNLDSAAQAKRFP